MANNKTTQSSQTPNSRVDSGNRVLTLIGRLTYSRWLVAAVFFIATALIVWNTVQRARELRAQEHLLVQTAINNAAREIELQLTELRRAVMLFAQGQRGLILQVARSGDGGERYEKLVTEVHNVFPEAFAVTVADGKGQAFIEDFEGFIEQICKDDIRRFAIERQAPGIFVHPNPLGYHFDIMVRVPLADAGQGIFFVSFLAKGLARRLATNQLPQYQLLLLRSDRDGLIELTETGARDTLERELFLKAEERRAIVYKTPVSGTLWELAALPRQPAHRLVQTPAYQQALLSLLVLAIVGLVAAWQLRRSDRNILVQSNMLARQADQLQQSHRLLSAISRAQSQYITETDPQTLFHDLLYDFLALTGSEKGSIGEVLYTGQGQHYFKVRATATSAPKEVTHESHDQRAQGDMEMYDPNPLFNAVMSAGMPVIYNDPANDPCDGSLREVYPHLSAFLGAPLYRAERLVGVVGLANRPGGYDQDLLEKLQPLISTGAHLFEAYRLAEQREQAQAKLSQSGTRMRAVLDNIIDGIITIDDSGVIESFNPAAEKIFGYSADELIGKNVSLLTPEPHRSRHDEYIENYKRTGEAKIIGIGREAEAQRKDGSRFPMELAVSEMWLGDRRMFTGVVRDITERKKVDRLKNEFISTVSHELRTPLTSIRGSIGLIIGGAAGEVPEKVSSLLRIAEDNSDRLVRLINDMLDVEKIESGRMQFDIQPHVLMPLVEQAIAANQAYGEQLGVRLELREHLSDAQVAVDADRITQVLTNLLSNAAKFSPEGGTVEVAVIRANGNIRVSVSDQGPGIPQEFRDRIFEKFAQADSSDSRQRGGTGLGLSISKAIVEKHGGRIAFETVPGARTCFYFDLPEWQIELVATERAVAGLGRSSRVLVCEDDPDVANLLGMMLEQDGFFPDIAYSAEQAKELLSRNQYAAMTVDIMLPDQDGISLIRELREKKQTRHLPVVVVSAKAEQNRQALNGGAIGIIDWLSKPIDQQRLLEAVELGASENDVVTPQILHVEDDADVVKVVVALLEPVAHITHARTLNEARRLLARDSFDLVILDVALPDGAGLELLPDINRIVPPLPVLVFSAQEMDKDAVRYVNSALVKSCTSNQDLIDTIDSLISKRGFYRADPR